MTTFQTDVSIDVGEPFVLFVSFHPSSGSFGLNFNGEALDDYAVVNKPPGMAAVKVDVSGSMAVNFLGFTNPGRFDRESDCPWNTRWISIKVTIS